MEKQQEDNKEKDLEEDKQGDDQADDYYDEEVEDHKSHDDLEIHREEKVELDEVIKEVKDPMTGKEEMNDELHRSIRDDITAVLKEDEIVIGWHRVK